ncbi:ABC transporter substrate-binding protein [Sphingomonas baiyangensis]|uniref:ABC transporter substrate-binding protein n=1 Tax=Sphingomonas baiyangensis TaxID=2572576 RepID=A0A4U1L3L5_9SPHN|nr:ABC transporter substrate-binding protein [Sphingomonas baiyangensis]TKD50715.1 ABC transporter substrate-binding protein [Sphingomonas baiyangensis]
MRLLLSLASLGLLLNGCQRRPDDVPVVVSAIGTQARVIDPARDAIAHPTAVLLDAVAQGLVRFDAAGQVEPGLAERWIVIDDGTSYIFRLREAQWPDGRPIRAAEVVGSLRRAVARASRISLRPHLAVIDEIVEMTPQVIEVRLSRPRPDLLTLFAQPEMAILDPRAGDGGTGPFRIASADPDGGTLLRPIADANAPADEAADGPDPEQFVRLHAERAALAIARFAARRSDLVSGGSFLEWPLIAEARVAPANRRIDPAEGLFGLAVVEREGFLAAVENREAVAMAIDRGALTAAFLPEWQPRDSILPEALDAAGPPARPGWIAFDLDDRRTAAAVRVAAWRAANGGAAPRLRVALPDGPGANLLWGHIGAALRAIGIEGERVALDADADLRLVDAVAPYDSARWYLVRACQPCAGNAAALITAARDARTTRERAELLTRADAALAADHAFIALARPLRWSLVALRLRAWRENARAWHPLNQLRRDPTS